MEVGRMPISASHRAKLISAGYSTLSSLSSLSSSDLARDLKISDNEAAEILKVASHSRRLDESAGGRAIVDGAQTAWDMLHEEEMFPLITTSSIDLDNILGGGINSKEVTEIACIEDLTECNSLLRKDFQAGQLKMHPNNILENIFYFCICSYTKQIALTNYLDKFISEHKDVKIVVVDSITFHFRQDFDDMALRTRLLSGMALKLMKLTKEYSLAVVLMNQVTTKHIEGSFQLTLALGE